LLIRHSIYSVILSKTHSHRLLFWDFAHWQYIQPSSSIFFTQVVFKHGTVRVLEMCVKFGNEEQKDKIFKIFKG